MKKLFFLLLVCVTTNLYAVPVKYTCDTPFWWNRTPLNVQCRDALYHGKKKARIALDRFLKKYPKRMIRKNLKRVVLMDNHGFKNKEWKDISKKYISERDDGRSHINDRDVYKGSNSLYKKGFVVKYGSTNVENDVNTYAEFLFVSPKRLKSIAK